MRKFLFFCLLFIGMIAGAQVVQPKSTTTFSNVNATGNLTVTGTSSLTGAVNAGSTIRATGAITTPTLYGSSSPSGTLNILATSSATAGAINLGQSGGSFNVNSGNTNINGTVSIGSSTAVGTSSLVQMYVTKGTSTVAIGDIPSSNGAIWFNQAVPSSSNYSFLGNGTNSIFNAPTGGQNIFRINNTTYASLNSNSVHITPPLRIGSTTAPTATLDVTGTMSVSGTSTLTGAVQTSTITSSSSLDLNAASGQAVTLKSNNSNVAQFYTTDAFISPRTQIGSLAGTPAATLSVLGTMSVSSTATVNALVSTGNITTSSGSLTIGANTNLIGNARLLSSNAATLTTGNTGTIAVLSDAVFPVQFNNSAVSPADGATYYIGNLPYGSITSATIGRHYLPYNCTLIGWSMSNIADGTPGSAESVSVSVRVNNSTDVSLSTSITFSASTSYTASGLSTNFSAGDLISIKVVCPTWVTNPTNFYSNLTLWFVRRQ